MEMVEVKTSELIGAALDFAVATANGWIRFESDSIECGKYWHMEPAKAPYGEVIYIGDYRPSTDWSQGGPLIFSHEITIYPPRHLTKKAEGWGAQFYVVNDLKILRGETPLIAACRAIVAAKLGDTVQVPAELL